MEWWFKAKVLELNVFDYEKDLSLTDSGEMIWTEIQNGVSGKSKGNDKTEE